MDQMPYKRVFTESTSIIYGTITAGGALLKKIIEEDGIILFH